MTTRSVFGQNPSPGLTAIVAILVLTVGLLSPLSAAEVAQKPLTLAVSSYQPNILLILDNSNTMVEGLTGTVAAECDPGPLASCVAGAASPLSKSEMIRSVGRQMVTDYEGQINLGLMAYQQYPMGDSWGDVFDDHVWVGWVGNRLYDVSYDPTNYSPGFPGSPWDDERKAFRTANPNVAGGNIHYNIGVPGYGPNNESVYCTTRNPGGGYLSEPFRFQCYEGKYSNTDNLPQAASNNECNNNSYEQSNGYLGRTRCTNGFLSDSARARGVTHWGQRMAFLQFNQREWVAIGSPGLGYLHTPIDRLSGAQITALERKLAPQHHDTTNPDLLTDPDEPVIVAGLTPLEGTLHTARTYFEGNGGATSSTFGSGQGWRNDLPAVPESCGVNATIWLTDGMPSVSMDGTALGNDVDQALDDAVAAAGHLHSGNAGSDTQVDVYVVGFAMPPNVPDDALERLAEAGGTSMPFLANNPAELFVAINDIFQQIIADSQAEFGSVSSGAVAIEGALGFRAQADPSDWTGDMIGLVNPNLPGEVERWRASEQMPGPAERNLLTADRPFTEAAFAADLAFEELFNQRSNPAENEIIARNLIRYVRGGSASTNPAELAPFNIVPFQRSSVIGAFNRGNPTLQRVRSFGWFRMPESAGGGSTYTDFVDAKESLREVVYVGSNLGVLHAFDLRTGEEVFGYVPRGVYPNLRDMATQDFRYTVDGEVRLFDAWDGSQWRQVLVGTLGAGGRSVYALDVTNPDNPQVMWEITDQDLPEPGHLGLTFAAAEPARLESGEWVVVMGNGYHSESNEARLLVLDLFGGGNVVHNVRLGDPGHASSLGNGLSTPRIAQDFSNRLTRSRWVYAGDLHGNLWRVELGESMNDSLEVERLFQGDRPITMQPQTIYPEEGAGYLVAFGTGKFFENQDDDITGAPTEYFYIINDTAAGGPGLSNLTRGGLSDRTPTGTATEFDLYAEGAAGWYIALDHGGRTGARALFTPDELIGRILLTSFRPDVDPCEVGGISEVYMMNLRFGSAAFPIGGDSYSAIVTSQTGAPVPAVYATRPTHDEDTGEATARSVISVGDQMIDIDDPDFDAAAMPRAFGERINWRQTR